MTRRPDGRIEIDFAEADLAWEAMRAKLSPAQRQAPIERPIETVPLEHFSVIRVNGQLALAVSDPANDHGGDFDDAHIYPLSDLVAADLALALMRQAAPEWARHLTLHFGRTPNDTRD